MITRATRNYRGSSAPSSVGMYDLLEDALDAGLVVVGPVFLGWFGLGPIADVPRASPSRGVNLSLLLGGKSDVRLGLVPYFALGPIADVSDPASSSGNFLMVGVNDVDGWLDVRRPEFRDVVEASSYRAWKGVFGNVFNAVNGQGSVSTPSSFQALTVFWPTRGRRGTHVAEPTSAERLEGIATARVGAICWFGRFCGH